MTRPLSEELEERLDRLAAAAPPWTDEQRALWSALLRPPTTEPATSRIREVATRSRKAA